MSDARRGLADRASRPLCRLRPAHARDARGVRLLPRLAGRRDRARRRERARAGVLRHERRDAASSAVRARRPLIMGIVNATPDSFSDAGLHQTLDERVELARSAAGRRRRRDRHRRRVRASPTARPSPPRRRSRGSCRVIERVVGELGARVSVDTYKPAVARAAIAAGACIVNDVSGLRDPALADVCARDRRGARDHAHDRAAQAAPARSLAGRAHRRRRPALPGRADRAGAGARGRVRAADARSRPGLLQDARADDRGAARRCRTCTRSGRPILLAVSRKDFVGALTGRAPRERLAGTLAAVGARRRRRRAHVPAARRRRGGRLLTVRGGAARASARSTPRCRSTTRLRWAQGDV